MADTDSAENSVDFIINTYKNYFFYTCKYPFPPVETQCIASLHRCILKAEGMDAYEEFRELVFQNQKTWSGAGTEKAATIATEYAAKIGASTRNLKNCMTSEAVLSEIENDMEEGAKYGVSGTPGVFVGTQIIPGAVGPEVLEAAVEAELNATRP